MTTVLPASVTRCNPDYNIAQIGVIIRWTPVKNLTFSADLTYTHLDQKMPGTVRLRAAPIGKPADALQTQRSGHPPVLLRAQRNW